MKIQGTRVDYTTKGPGGNDKRTGENPTPSTVGDATNAKIPIDGVENQNTENDTKSNRTTRQVTGS
jgi:hypothetical protein